MHQVHGARSRILRRSWEAKNKLPDEVFEMPFFPTEPQMASFNVVRVRCTRRELAKLRTDQATGPDLIAAILLKRLSHELGLPVAIIARRVFREGWPAFWKKHWLILLFKKGSVYDPGKYRVIRLSCIMSKMIERVIGSPLIKFLQARGFGDAQWAFRKHAGFRDFFRLSC